jgi:hypothetical protein
MQKRITNLLRICSTPKQTQLTEKRSSETTGVEQKKNVQKRKNIAPMK